MHKSFSVRVVAAIIFIIASLGISTAYADVTSPWINSTLSIHKQADTLSIPATLGGNGNIDCAMEDSTNCAVPTTYGTAAQNGLVRLNSSSGFLPVITFVDNRQHFLPVPNSDTVISYFSGPPYGLDLAFNYNFSSSITKSNGTLQINRAPDARLTDRAKHLLAADTASMSFSENGRWMVVSDPNVAMLRVDLQSFEVMPFAAGLNYTIGLDPGVKTAITNDGRYAMVASKDFDVFKLYDLSTCSVTPDTINGANLCTSRDLGRLMQQAVSGYSFVANARFVDENALAVYAVYKSGTTNRTARFIVSSDGSINQLDYLALGDSYISGEGAFDYVGGTDTDSNRCHLSFLSYPYLIGHDLDYDSYHSVACSGAATNDIINTGGNYKGQARNVSRSDLAAADLDPILASYKPGYIDQLDFVKTYQPKIITVSIGGNDMGFSAILTSCVEPKLNNTCYSNYEDRLELIRQINNTVYPRLVHTYQKLKAAGPPDMRVYVIGYPQIAKPGGDCALNVRLNSDEILFSQELINYLDSIIQAAADRSGVYYVDTQDSLNGHRLCEAGSGSVAVNGLTLGNDRPTKLGGPLGDESYHPNATGYELIENKILAATHNLTDPMPTPHLNSTLPPENGQVILDTQPSGRAVKVAEFDPGISDDLAFQQTPLDISISGARHSLVPGMNLQAEVHTTPVSLGSFKSDGSGNLSTQVTIPEAVSAGYHTLHFYGADLAGQSIDIYKNIYIAKSADDLDGDGILDSIQKCVGVAPAGQDFDQDGVDDACDANITQPPSRLTQNNNNDQLSQKSEETNQVSEKPVSQIGPPNIQTFDMPILTVTSAVDPVDQVFDHILIPSSRKEKAHVDIPSVLSATINKPTITPQYSVNNGSRTKYFVPGLLTILTGALGIVFKRFVV